ncbi:MAG: thiamine diphosphokinase [Polaribacter sp.]
MKKSNSVFLILNGKAPKSYPKLDDYSLVCATDGALTTLKSNGVEPDLVFGDFDSVDPIPDETEIVLTQDQEYTDFEKTLALLHESGYQNIDVFGASGEEQDHFLGNLHVALAWKDKLQLNFFDDYGHYQFIPNQFEMNDVLNKTISLFPFPKATNITSHGLEFELIHTNLELGVRVGTRNRAIKDQVRIEFSEGNLLVFIQERT